jgi:hypothetical protein
MDKEAIRQALTALLADVAAKAKEDALAGRSDIGSIYRREGERLSSLDPEAVEAAIVDINKATATKEGARRLMNGLMVIAKAAAKVVFPAA